MPYSDNFLENAYSRSSPNAVLTLMTVNIDGNLYHYVNNNESVVSTVSGSSRTYQPAAFNISLPEDTAEGTPKATLSFDPADNAVVRRLRSASSRLEMTLYVVLSNALNVVEFGPVNYESTDFSIDAGNISIGLEVEPVLDRVVPARRFTPHYFPGLWDREDV